MQLAIAKHLTIQAFVVQLEAVVGGMTFGKFNVLRIFCR